MKHPPQLIFFSIGSCFGTSVWHFWYFPHISSLKSPWYSPSNLYKVCLYLTWLPLTTCTVHLFFMIGNSFIASQLLVFTHSSFLMSCPVASHILLRRFSFRPGSGQWPIHLSPASTQGFKNFLENHFPQKNLKERSFFFWSVDLVYFILPWLSCLAHTVLL